MGNFTGTVRHNDLEGGFWELVTDGGKVYRLEGGTPTRAGARVRVHGTVEQGGFGIHMTGTPAIVVERIEALD